MSELVIKNLHVNIEGKEILKGLDLTIKQGEIHAIMGPNGTGKSTLAYTLMGHPSYTVTEGEVTFKGQTCSIWRQTNAHGLVFSWLSSIPFPSRA